METGLSCYNVRPKFWASEEVAHQESGPLSKVCRSLPCLVIKVWDFSEVEGLGFSGSGLRI